MSAPRLPSFPILSCLALGALSACGTRPSDSQLTASSSAVPLARAVEPQTPAPEARPEAAPTQAEQGCPKAKAEVRSGRLGRDELDEVSGIAASRTQPGVLWVHNDSGDTPRVFAIRPTGEVLQEVLLRGAQAVDFEDIAVGPGPEPGRSYLYVADIGDNFARRDQVQIYRVQEPAVGSHLEKRAAEVFRMDVTYPGGARDAETLLSDPRTGDLFIVSKASMFFSNGEVGVYRIAASELQSPRVTPELVASVQMGPATAGDILPDGSGIVVRNYSEASFWRRLSQQSIADALKATPCTLPVADKRDQGESFAFSADGRGYYTVSEGSAAAIYYYGFE